MIRVLIVEDDKLIRKGLIASMPWSEYDMTVVGEAGNGQTALEFLQEQEADLVLTDIEMPVMSGLDFIKTAGSLYPHLSFVVLTVFADFDYIQQALRLGAIDYIAKIQIDKENFNTILERIHNRLQKSKVLDHSNGDREERPISGNTLYALLSIEDIHNDSDGAKDFFILNNLSGPNKPFEIGAGIFLWNRESETYLFPDCFDDCMLLKINGVNNSSLSELRSLLYKYKKSQFFYDYNPVHQIHEKDISELQEDTYITKEEDFQYLKERWLSFNWINQAELFDKIKIDLRRSKLTAAKIYHLMAALENAWNRCYGSVLGKTLTMPDAFRSWLEIEQWLESLYQNTDFAIQSLAYSEEITESIMKAKKLADTEYMTQLISSDVAGRIHMSRSYFNQCFRDIVGESFGNYLRLVRINKAKEFLALSNKSIRWIAWHTGYEDEKYFSRIFKKETGRIPSDYRKEYQYKTNRKLTVKTNHPSHSGKG